MYTLFRDRCFMDQWPRCNAGYEKDKPTTSDGVTPVDQASHLSRAHGKHRSAILIRLASTPRLKSFRRCTGNNGFSKTSFKMSPRIANPRTITLLAHSPFNTSMARTVTQRSNRSCVISAMLCNHAVTVGLHSSPHASLLETQRSHRHSVFHCTAHTPNLLNTS